MIVDCHTHIWLPEHLGPPFVDEVRGPGGRPPDLTADPVAHRAGTAEADAVCVFAFEAPRVASASRTSSSPSTCGQIPNG